MIGRIACVQRDRLTLISPVPRFHGTASIQYGRATGDTSIPPPCSAMGVEPANVTQRTECHPPKVEAAGPSPAVRTMPSLMAGVASSRRQRRPALIEPVVTSLVPSSDVTAWRVGNDGHGGAARLRGRVIHPVQRRGPSVSGRQRRPASTRLQPVHAGNDGSKGGADRTHCPR